MVCVSAPVVSDIKPCLTPFRKAACPVDKILLPYISHLHVIDLLLALFDTTSRAVAADGPAAGAALRVSHPSEDLSELPPLLVSVAGQGYHCRLTGSWRNSLPELLLAGWTRSHSIGRH